MCLYAESATCSHHHTTNGPQLSKYLLRRDGEALDPPPLELSSASLGDGSNRSFSDAVDAWATAKGRATNQKLGSELGHVCRPLAKGACGKNAPPPDTEPVGPGCTQPVDIFTATLQQHTIWQASISESLEENCIVCLLGFGDAPRKLCRKIQTTHQLTYLYRFSK